ncbi:metalloregulator ArsR/SmtB family transcription factor [Alkalimonas mucilaginosa]|uniref:Metalloregulator ArsR/SmtB family transcription factor n=1 Tax=Alkalimonas mucilaginosa TaxID=3057676 RepID=A0ABU7JDI9_9GAMM|nr:metalloregulator ArsR/SmtB family transcription factor [Alkalimonas sp. MEB004]MEE2023230.1 metalloregulator ArsR/SmtB family transcription factor [Alkalimonas sp. MEB004]
MHALQLFKALSDDTRLRIVLLILQEQELCVCELTCALDLPQPKISRHLALLRQMELLTDRRQGQWVYYRLSETLPNWVTQVLHTTLQQQDYLHPTLQRLNKMGSRPERTNQCC